MMPIAREPRRAQAGDAPIMPREAAVHAASGGGITYTAVPHRPRREGDAPGEYAVMKSMERPRGETYHPVARGLARAAAIEHCDRLARSAAEIAANLAKLKPRPQPERAAAPGIRASREVPI